MPDLHDSVVGLVTPIPPNLDLAGSVSRSRRIDLVYLLAS